MDDFNALKIMLYYFADKVLNARKDYSQINFSLLNQVDDLDHFWNHLWGCLSWEMIYDRFDNALNGKDKKFKKSRWEKSNLKIKKYNIYSFTPEVQVFW